jgi:hypothetical protein
MVAAISRLVTAIIGTGNAVIAIDINSKWVGWRWTTRTRIACRFGTIAVNTIVTSHRSARLARTTATTISSRAGVIIVTRVGIVRVLAANGRIATVVCADIVVVTFFIDLTELTLAGGQVAGRALGTIVNMVASFGYLVTAIIGTGNAVIAIDSREWGRWYWTAFNRIAGWFDTIAVVTIVTVYRITWLTDAATTNISVGTNVTSKTSISIIHVLTTTGRITTIVSADITIVTT